MVLAGSAWGAVPADASDPALAPPMLLALAAIVLLLAIGIAAALRTARTRDRLTAQLRETRTRVASLESLLDVWSWQTDVQHRLVSIRPPMGAPAADWSPPPGPVLLWERFGAADPAVLQAMLTSAAPLDDLEVALGGGTGVSRRGRLRALPHADADGVFAGYHGTFRENAPASAAPAPIADAGANDDAPAGDHESFSFTVSHDLRAPIRVVEGFTKIVKEDYGRLLDRVGNDHLDRVLGAAARMNNMIDALLALSKLSSQPLARQPVNLSQLAGYVADDLRRQWPQRRVQIDIEPGMLVQGDPTLLRVVIENLLGNAWKYSARAAQATVSFARHARDADTFTVQDNGAGFDMRFADRLFGVFQRLHSANDFPGTGVGLASVRRIVRRHGGEVWGEAEVGRGARFHFSLPQRGDSA
jgi:signal transduction histidine kinase